MKSECSLLSSQVIITNIMHKPLKQCNNYPVIDTMDQKPNRSWLNSFHGGQRIIVWEPATWSLTTPLHSTSFKIHFTFIRPPMHALSPQRYISFNVFRLKFLHIYYPPRWRFLMLRCCIISVRNLDMITLVLIENFSETGISAQLSRFYLRTETGSLSPKRRFQLTVGRWIMSNKYVIVTVIILRKQ